MIMPVSGSAIRFVSMNCDGNVLKYIYTSGPVVIWHDIDIAAESHSHLAILVSGASSCLSPGQNPCIHGNMNAIPVIAAYDSWNPTSFMDDGDNARCISMAVSSVFFRMDCLPLSLTHSPIKMKMNALAIDAPAPVAKV